MPVPATTPVEPPRIERASRVVWALAWPAVALNSLQVVNSMLDAGFVGHLDKASLTAYGGMTPVLFLMFSFAMSLATAATALVSRFYGAEDAAQCRLASRQSLSLSLFGGVGLAAVCWALAPTFAQGLLPQTAMEAIGKMADFFRIYALGLPAIFVIQALAGSLRGVGDTKSPMVISGLQIFTHIALNFILIFPPKDFLGMALPGANMGLMGAATALSVSAWLSAAIYVLYAGRTRIGKQWNIGLPRPDWMWRIIRIAAPAAVMSVLRVGSLTVFQLVLAKVPDGETAIAAMRTGFAIESIMFMPSFGLSMAASALVGQSLGMKRPDRAEALGWIAGHHAAIVTFVLCIPIYFTAESIAGLMLGDKADVIAQAALLIRYLCVTEIFFAYAMVMIGAMQGAGDTKRPLWLSVVSLWMLRVPFAYYLALPAGNTFLGLGLGYGAPGAWLAMTGSQAVQGILSIWLFKLGGWKQAKV